MAKTVPGDPQLNSAGGRPAPPDNAYTRIAQDCWSQPAPGSSASDAMGISGLSGMGGEASRPKDVTCLGFPDIELTGHDANSTKSK